MKYLDAGQSELFDRAGTPYANSLLGLARHGEAWYARDNQGRLHSQQGPSGRHFYLHHFASTTGRGRSGKLACDYSTTNPCRTVFSHPTRGSTNWSR